MNAGISKKQNLFALDIALLLFGMLVMSLVLKLLRFDDPNPLHNALTYLLGVPTVLIAVSMVTRVLTNDLVEKSIQLGFLISVCVHLIFMFAAINVVLFNRHWPANAQKVAMEATTLQPRAAQFFEPKTALDARPDYMKPVPTDQNQAIQELTPPQEKQQPSQIELDLAKDEIQPRPLEKPFNKPRKEASPSQPTIASAAEKLERPDLANDAELLKSRISIPEVEPTRQPVPNPLEAVELTPERTVQSDQRNSLASPNASKAVDAVNADLVHLGANQRMENKSAQNHEGDMTRALDRSLTQTTSVPERPKNPVLRSHPEDSRPKQSEVPIPKLGQSAPSAPMDRPTERSTQLQSRSSKSNASPLSSTAQGTRSTFEPNMKQGQPIPLAASSAIQQPGRLPSERDFLEDPRFAMNSNPGSRSGGSEARSPSNSFAPSSQAIPVEEYTGSVPRIMNEAGPDASELKPTEGSGFENNSVNRPRANSSASTNPSLLAPKISGLPNESLNGLGAAAVRDLQRKGPDVAKRELIMPEIRDIEFSADRFKRPETGGPKLTPSAVPIPAPAFSQRLQRNKNEQGAAEMGPLGPQTEAAIELGLQFLSRHQREDGSWKLEDFDERVEMRSDTAATALALLSFQGAGYTHKQFKYADVCKGAVQWLTENQRSNGDLYVRSDAKSDSNAWLYSHAIATLALCESYGMTQDESIQGHAQRAINFLVQSQDPQAGGWRYQPRIGSDTSVTGWCMMALKSAELSGLKVPKETYAGITKWLNASQASDQQRYLYRYNWQAADTPATRHGRVATPVMTSVGLLMRLYLGWRRNNPEMEQGADWLLEKMPTEGTTANPQRDTYYWYYATQVIFHMGGNRWKAWYEKLYPMLIQSQLTNGQYAGSWEPNGKIPDAWGRFGGRLYVTTLNLLSLEVYYRHLPIYEATAD